MQQSTACVTLHDSDLWPLTAHNMICMTPTLKLLPITTRALDMTHIGSLDMTCISSLDMTYISSLDASREGGNRVHCSRWPLRYIDSHCSLDLRGRVFIYWRSRFTGFARMRWCASPARTRILRPRCKSWRWSVHAHWWPVAWIRIGIFSLSPWGMHSPRKEIGST